MSRRGAGIAGNSAIATAPGYGGAMPPTVGNLVVPGASIGVPGTKPITHTGTTWADAYGGMGLARPPQDFTHGAFGPYTPILSMPIDEPNPNTGQPDARREQYRIGWNLPVGTPGAEGLKLADFQTLQTLADLYSVARACIEYLKREITSLEWDILPTQDAAKAMRNDPSAMKDFGKRRAEAIKFFRRPDPDYFSWQTWLSVVLEEILVYDALSLVLKPKWGLGRGKGILGSDLDCLEIINGPTIRPLYDIKGRTPRPPAVAYQQYMYGVPRVDLGTMLTERDIEQGALRGYEAQPYLASQLIYLPMVPRRWTPYGFPPVERSLIPVISGLSKQGYALDYFKEGTVPAVYISPGGDLSPNQIRELQDALNAVAGDPAYHHKIIVLPSGSSVLPQRDATLADQFDEIIMTQTCMGFGVQPMQVGIMPRVSSSASSGAANQMAKQSSNVQDQATLQPHTIFLSVLMERILSDVCGQDDMRFVFDGMEEEEDQETLTNLVVNQWSNGMLTTDEGRDALGYQPYGLPETTIPLVKTATGVMPLTTAIQSAQSTADAAQQAVAQGANGGLPVNNEGQLADAQHGGTGDGGDGSGGKPSGVESKPAVKKPASGSRTKPGAGDAANAMAEGTDQASSAGTGAGNSGKAAQPVATTPPPPPPPQSNALQDATETAIAAIIVKRLMAQFLDLYAGRISTIQALEGATTALQYGYLEVMTKASAGAVQSGDAAARLSADVIHGLAAARAAAQQPYLLGVAQDVHAASTAATDLSWLPARTKLYSEGLHGASQQAYGATVKATKPLNGLVWRLGETEHCPLCLARDGKSYTFKTMPGWPGDGGFGGPLCLGGPNCGCHYDYVENGKVVDQGFNTQRPESIAYYAQQSQDIATLRQQAHEARLAFIAGLPNKIGSDGTSSQMRAMARYQLERQLASLANQRIQSTGGYGGVSVEPSDIPASIIASLLPPGHEADLNVPITDLMDAIEQMYAGTPKFVTADLTKTAFTQTMHGAVQDHITRERRVEAELDACARHLIKGREPLGWRCEKIGVLDVGQLHQSLQNGMTRGQAVAAALHSRRYVSLDGQVIEPQPTQADEETATLPDIAGNDGVEYFGGEAAGSGGAYPLPHDANGIYHDLHDLKPVRKSAADLSDPNPVEPTHVLNLMRQNFPEKALNWVSKATWIGPVKVPTDRFDVDDEASWAAAHEDDKVKHFKQEIKKKSAHLHPVIGVQVLGDDRVKIVDGHHRFLAYRALGKKVPAYVGTVNDGSDDWAETHSSQLNQGDSPANKAADTPSKEQDTARLRHYWAHGEGAIKVRWGEPGDFDRCVKHVGKFMDDPKGYCAERHHEALGIWPATHAKEIRDGEKLAKPKIVKVGPHGYIHGWIYVGPEHDVGSEIDHPEHGHGIIHAADKDSIEVTHDKDGGEVKHYAATFVNQKAKFVKTGSLEGKTHIANVKPLKDGSVVNKDDGKTIGHVGKLPDGSWMYMHKDSGASDDGFVSKHKAIVGLIQKHNEHADTHVAAPSAAVHESGITQHADDNVTTIKKDGQTVGFVSSDNLGAWYYTHGPTGKDSTFAYNTKQDAADALMLHHEDIESGTHASMTAIHEPNVKLTSLTPGTHGVSIDGDPVGHVKDSQSGSWSYFHGGTDYTGPSYASKDDAVNALVTHHAASLQSAMDHSLSQDDAAHEALTHGESHVEPSSLQITSPSDYQGIGHIGDDDKTYSIPGTNGEKVVVTADGKKIGTLNRGEWGNTYGSFTHADGHTEEFGESEKGIGDAKSALLTYHNGKYGDHITTTIDGPPKSKLPDHLEPESVSLDENLEFGLDATTPDGTHLGSLNYDGGKYVSFTHADGTSHALTEETMNPGKAKKELVAYHNDKHDSTTSEPEKPDYAKIGAKQTHEVVTALNDNGKDFDVKADGTVIGTISADGGKVTSITHADGTKLNIGSGDLSDVKSTLLTYHNSKYGDSSPTSELEKPDYAKVGSLQPIETTNHMAADGSGFDIKDNKGVKVGSINFDQEKGQGYSSVTHADGTTMPIVAHTSAEAKSPLLMYHNGKYGDHTLPKPEAVVTAGENPVTPASVAENVAKLKPTPWTWTGPKVGPKDVVTKQSGDVIVKGSTTKIGTIVNTGHGFQAVHEDGFTAKYNKKSEALAGLTNHHNQSVAIKKAVKPDANSDLAKSPKLSTYYHQTKIDYVTGNVVDKNGAKIGNLEDNGDGTFTITHKSGATWKATVDGKYSANQSLVAAHNQAIDVSHGKSTHEAPPIASHAPNSSGPTAYDVSGSHVKISFTHSKMVDGQPLSSAEYKGIKKYTGNWYSTINKKIAGDKVGADDDLEKYGSDAAAMHTGLQRSELTHDMVLHRGVGDANAMLGPMGSGIGNVQVQHSFMSTSTGSGFGGNLKLVIHAPKGAKGMNVKTFSNYPSEAEILFQHGTAYRVDSDEMVGHQRTAHITLVGQYNSDGSVTPYAKFGES